MSISLLGLVLALNVKGFHDWDPRAKVVVCLVGGVIAIMLSVALIRRVGWVAIVVPAAMIGLIVMMNQNSGCLEHAGDLKPVEKTP